MCCICPFYTSGETIRTALNDRIILPEDLDHLNEAATRTDLVQRTLKHFDWNHGAKWYNPLTWIRALIITPIRRSRVESAVNDVATSILRGPSESSRLLAGHAESAPRTLTLPRQVDIVHDVVVSPVEARRRELSGEETSDSEYATPMGGSPEFWTPKSHLSPAHSGTSTPREVVVSPRLDQELLRDRLERVAEDLQDRAGSVEQHLARRVEQDVEDRDIVDESKETDSRAPDTNPQMIPTYFLTITSNNPGLGRFVGTRMLPPNPTAYQLIRKEGPDYHKFTLEYGSAQRATIPSIERGGYDALVGVTFNTPQRVTGKLDYDNNTIEFDAGQLVGKKRIGWGPFSKDVNVCLRKVQFFPVRGDVYNIQVTVDGPFGQIVDTWNSRQFFATFQNIQWS